jgi:hypothetical protein
MELVSNCNYEYTTASGRQHLDLIMTFTADIMVGSPDLTTSLY